MPINYKTLGKRISIARNSIGMTQEVLAERINCSTSYISYIETGAKHLSMDYFVEIANALDCTADELLIDQLGAFGCGAFSNDPNVVARAYHVAVEDYKDRFSEIEFAIYCRDYETENYKVFHNEFG